MAYTKTIWTDGAIITASKLNNIENQVEEVTNLLGSVSGGVQGPQGEKGEKGEQGEPGVAGANGKEIELTVSAGYIKWRYVGDSGWKQLIAVADLKGEKGDAGSDADVTALEQKIAALEARIEALENVGP